MISSVQPVSDEDQPMMREGGSNGVGSATAGDNSDDNNNIVDYYGGEKSLIIPITSSSTLLPNGQCQFIEIFPEEISNINPVTLSTVLRDERAPLQTWCEASLLYMRSNGSSSSGGGGGTTHHEKEGCELLNLAVDNDDVMNGSNTTDRLRVLASAGIAALAQANRHAGDVGRTSTSGGGSGSGGGGAGADIGSLLDDLLESSKLSEKQDAELREELRTLADSRFVKADNINQVNPMTWIGRGMLNLAQNKLDQARFFFENLTLRECGETLPALLGMAAVKFLEKDYNGALDLYSRAIRKYPNESGSVTRVGFGMACYRLGQVDRAKAAFRRAHDMDAENVEALVALAVLEMSSLDGDVLAPREYRARAENVLKLLSMANVVDHTNAMVQNHLANHYFWKWTPVPGMVSVEQGLDIVRGNMVSSLEVGDRIRIGHDFETVVIADEIMDENGNNEYLFKIKDRWKFGSACEYYFTVNDVTCDIIIIQKQICVPTSFSSSRLPFRYNHSANLKIWKKDYDRVVSLAKGAYNSTNMPEVQAESLYMLARVFHARGDMEQANKFYDKACLLSPELSPARFGLAQTLIWDEAYDEAAAHLRLLLGTCSNATDALAALGLLEVKSGKDRREAFMYLKKAIDLDPFNSDLVLIEALALQQQESDYPLSLDRYRKAVRLLEAQGKKVSVDVLTNMGVLCHETKLYDEALDMYSKALKAVEAESNDTVAVGADENGDVTFVKHKENDLFWKYVDTDIRVESTAGDDKTRLIVSSSQTDINSIGVKVGDDISLDGGIETTIKELSKGDDGTIHVTVGDEVDLENSKSALSVKRCNGRLRNPNSISIAFNLARLHESSGRIVPAVELHKAILKQHPAYVNSYLRLACIARDCGSLKDCSEWLKMAVAVAPGNPEVLTLVGNLHLSLCDWAPAQNVFDQLLQQKGKNPMISCFFQIIVVRRYAHSLHIPT
jgi:RNA polymerase-associated protein CTR9